MQAPPKSRVLEEDEEEGGEEEEEEKEEGKGVVLLFASPLLLLLVVGVLPVAVALEAAAGSIRHWPYSSVSCASWENREPTYVHLEA